MFQDAFAAFSQILTPPFRATLLKVLALTITLLAFIGVGLDHFILSWAQPQNVWLAWALSWLTGVGLFVGLAFLIAPVSLLVAGFFLDDLAHLVEMQTVGPLRLGRALPAGSALWIAAKFAIVVLFVNLCALLLLLVPGVNVIAFLTANAYLLGREYFELSALRYRSLPQAHTLRAQNSLYVFLCGLLIAALLSVPILNLLTPLFGVAFMVRVHQRVAPLPVSETAQAGLAVSN